MTAIKMARLSFLFTVCASLLAGCSDPETDSSGPAEQAQEQPQEQVQAQSGDDSLLRLHDIWVLETMDGNALELDSEAQRPRMELNYREMTISGFDGCNNMSGGIRTLEGQVIEFGPLATTRMACPNMELPDSFQQHLTRVRGYSRQDMKLYLLDDQGNELLSFQKTD